MKLLTSLTTALFLTFGGDAFAVPSPSVCLTLNRPGKWDAGLVLRIFSEVDGSKSATLLQVSMFRGTSAQSSLGQGLGVINQISGGDTGAGGSSYIGGTGDNKLNATLGAPDQYGAMAGSVDVQISGLEIHTNGASLSRFSGDHKCE